MAFNLSFRRQTDDWSDFKLEIGEVLFVVGANGSGKSSLLSHFVRQNLAKVPRVSAHRQTWLPNEGTDMTPVRKVHATNWIMDEDRHPNSRYVDTHGADRASMTIYDLIAADNVRARAITAAVDSSVRGGSADAANVARSVESPIQIINEAFRHSNINIKLSIQGDYRLMAKRDDSPPYNAAELSDGERNALMIAANILTCPNGFLIVIDEPERHLHRAISAPLLGSLLKHRSDCGFVVSTHDHDMALAIPDAKVILLRSCYFSREGQIWDADKLPASGVIDDNIKRDLLGARRKILFTEGTSSSLDVGLYSIIFPMVSVIPKGSCHQVEEAVIGARAVENYHWIQAFGIVDGDGFSQEIIDEKRRDGIYAVPYYSVEAIYYNPTIIGYVAHRQAAVDGSDAEEMTRNALNAAIVAVAGHTDRLSRNIAKKTARKIIMEQIPNDDELIGGCAVDIRNDAGRILSERKTELDDAVQAADWGKILTKCPIRESGARKNIAHALNLRDRHHYERAVRQLLTEKDEALDFVRALFCDLFEKLDGSSVRPDEDR